MSVYRFGDYRLDPVRRKLFRRDHQVHLPPKATDLLCVLVEHAGSTVDRDTIFQAVWAGAVVEENTVARNVLLIRKALRESAGENTFIVTVAGLGYRFVAKVEYETGASAGSSAADQQPSPGWPRRHATLLFICSAALALGLAIWYHSGASTTALSGAPPGAPPEFREITSTGNVLKTTISRDGRRMFFVLGSPGRQALIMRDLESGGDVELVRPAPLHYMGLTSSPAGDSVYYVARGTGDASGTLYRVGVQSRTSEQILSPIESPLAIAPNGDWAYVRQDDSTRLSSVVVAKGGGAQPRVVASVPLPRYFDYPAWSPDGKRLAVTTIGELDNHLSIIGSRDSTRMRLGDRWGYVMRPNWSSDGRRLFVIGRSQGARRRQLWLVFLTSGRAEPLSNDSDEYLDLSVGSNDFLYAIRRKLITELWVSEVARPGALRQLAAGPDEYSDVGWTPQGSIVYAQVHNGERTIWTVRPDGSGRRRLQLDGSNYAVSVCRDTGDLLFASTQGDFHSLRMSGPSGQSPKEVSRLEHAASPHCAPDGSWYLYIDRGRANSPLMKRTFATGEDLEVSAGPTAAAAVSPEGISVAQLVERPSAIRILSTEGALKAFFHLPVSSELLPSTIRWTPDGQSIAYVDRSGDGAVLTQPIHGKAKPRRVTEAPHGPILYFDWSRDYKYLAYIRTSVSCDIWRAGRGIAH